MSSASSSRDDMMSSSSGGSDSDSGSSSDSESSSRSVSESHSHRRQPPPARRGNSKPKGKAAPARGRSATARGGAAKGKKPAAKGKSASRSAPADKKRKASASASRSKSAAKGAAKKKRKTAKPAKKKPTAAAKAKAKAAAAKAAEDKKKKKKHKKRKDKNAPKLPATPYMVFNKDQRVLLSKEMPNASFADISKEIARRWGLLSPQEKQPFHDRSNQEKQQYKIAYAKYRETKGPSPPVSDSEDDDGVKGRVIRDPKFPKRPQSAYIFFANYSRESAKEKLGPNYKITEIMKKLGEMWTQMSDAEKEPFERKAAEDRERFKREMAAYTPAEGFDARGRKRLKGKKKKRAKKDPKAPKRSSSAYLLYCKYNRDVAKNELDAAYGVGGYKVTEVMRRLSVKWAQMPPEAKTKYEEMAAADRSKYLADIAAYRAAKREAAAQSKEAANAGFQFQQGGQQGYGFVQHGGFGHAGIQFNQEAAAPARGSRSRGGR